MANVIFVVAIIILLCVLLNRLSTKMGIPMLLCFILLGMVFGEEGIFKIHFENYGISDHICSIALIFIIFYGGFGTNWGEARPVVLKSSLLSTLGVFFTAFLTGLFCFYVLHFEFLESLLIGSVISSTDAASVFFILRSQRLGLKYNTSSMLEIESGSNDPASYMLTVIMLSIISGNTRVGNIIYMLFAQFFYGIVIGVIIALVALYILKNFQFGTAGFDIAFVIAVALVSYSLPTLVGGNGYLSAYIVGIILGNGKIKKKQTMVHFFDGLTSLMQMLIFFLLGLLVTPSDMLPILIPSIGIALFLTLLARPISVFLILSPFRCKIPQHVLVSFAGLRGVASIVFAIMAIANMPSTNNDIFHIVFCIVLMSILIQGSLIPVIAKKLKMIDENADVLKTFNDYSDESNLQSIQILITEEHPWRNQIVRELSLPPDILMIMITREQKTVIPRGKTKILKGDVIALGGVAFSGNIPIRWKEEVISKKSKWINKSISEFSTNLGEVVMIIKYDGRVVSPRDSTVIDQDDVLVMNSLSD